MKRRAFVTLAALALIALLLQPGGCPNPSSPSSTSGTGKLVHFDSAQALLTYFKQQASANLNRSYSYLADNAGAVPTSSQGDQATGAEGGSSSDDAYTTTNVQEAGVDESDVFKSDGTYFYVARGQTLRIVRATPPDQLAEVSQLDLGVPIDSLYLYGSTVIALGMEYGGTSPTYAGGIAVDMIYPPYYQASSLAVVQVDVSDPASPSIARQMTLDGSLVTSRVTNDRLILVLTIVPNLPATPTVANVQLMTLDQVMPKLRLSGVERDLVSWDGWLRPTSPDGYNMTGIVTLDAAEVTTVVGSTAVLANAGTIYASSNALYITDANYDPDNNYREQTTIHKFTFDSDGAAVYAATGDVPGRLLNQFSLGEYEGYLRVATHVNNFDLFPIGMDVAVSNAPSSSAGSTSQSSSSSSNVPYNGVYVLGQSGSDLNVTGFVDGIAPNETIYSARFLDDHGFLVTYHKIDPLFVLDLRDPTAPTVLGQLTIPGFSDYLHPIDATHLVGVGKWTSPTTDGFDWYQGVQISLFDVSDWSNPQVVQQIQLGGRGSECDVSFTHKAFTYLADSHLLALPMGLTTIDSIPWEYGDPTFSGVVVYRVDPSAGFTELGRIDAVGENASPMFGWVYWNNWRRAAIIGDDVYALTGDGIRTAPVDAFSSTTTLTFTD